MKSVGFLYNSQLNGLNVMEVIYAQHVAITLLHNFMILVSEFNTLRAYDHYYGRFAQQLQIVDLQPIASININACQDGT